MHEEVNSKYMSLEKRYNDLNSHFDSTMEGFEKLWDIERKVTQEEKDTLEIDINNMLCDAEEVYDSIVEKMDDIQFQRA